jgi:hypothetical protein
LEASNVNAHLECGRAADKIYALVGAEAILNYFGQVFFNLRGMLFRPQLAEKRPPRASDPTCDNISLRGFEWFGFKRSGATCSRAATACR